MNEYKYEIMTDEEERMIEQMYQEWLAEQDLGGEPEGDSLYW